MLTFIIDIVDFWIFPPGDKSLLFIWKEDISIYFESTTRKWFLNFIIVVVSLRIFLVIFLQLLLWVLLLMWERIELVEGVWSILVCFGGDYRLLLLFEDSYLTLLYI